MDIRHATAQDLPALGQLYTNAKAYMARMGNPGQWEEGYPHCVLERDLQREQLYVCEEGSLICAAFVMAQGDEPTYQVIDGAWKNDLPYVTLHRVASTGEKRGMMDVIVRWAFAKSGNVRGDTHAQNLPMRRAFERNGFEHCGTVWVEDGTSRMAYHKVK